MFERRYIKTLAAIAIAFGSLQSAYAEGSGNIGSGGINPAGLDISDSIESFTCTGQFRGGYGTLTVKSSGADQFKLHIELPGEDKPIDDTFTLKKMVMTLERIEIGGFRVTSSSSDKTGLLIKIPLTDGKARVWKVWDGLEDQNIVDHVDEEGVTICNVVQKKN